MNFGVRRKFERAAKNEASGVIKTCRASCNLEVGVGVLFWGPALVAAYISRGSDIGKLHLLCDTHPG